MHLLWQLQDVCYILFSFCRLVNKVLEEELKVIHAFQMKTLTPEQWEKTKAS